MIKFINKKIKYYNYFFVLKLNKKYQNKKFYNNNYFLIKINFNFFLFNKLILFKILIKNKNIFYIKIKHMGGCGSKNDVTGDENMNNFSY